MVVILQPQVLHYREEFFKGLNNTVESDIFCYKKRDVLKSENFKKGDVVTNSILNVQLGPFLLYNPFVFLKRDYQTLVLMLHFGHITTWLLLLTKPIHKKKIILWGHGISVKRYFKEEQKPNLLLSWMISLADKVWLYTDKEQKRWQKMYPDKEIISLNNTISDVEKIVGMKNKNSKEILKQKFKIKQEICFVFCARFTNRYRRVDLLLKIIKQLDCNKYGFIIIGDGPFKPNFIDYYNVYDFGSVYDREMKDQLFLIADLYLQPGWVGLSIVEALAYGKPILTFKRSEEVLQCVEYSYLINEYNAMIFETIEEAIIKIINLSRSDIETMSANASQYVQNNLLMKNMINNAIKTIL